MTGERGSRPLHVELVLGSAAVGGTERQVLRLARELRSAGLTVSMVLLDGNGPLIDEIVELKVPLSIVGYGGISPSRIPGVPTKNSFRGLWRLVRHSRPSGVPDVSHAFLDGAVAVAPLLDWPWRRHRPRRVAGVRGNRQGTPGTRRRFARAVQRADAVVCNAPHLAKEMIGIGADPDRVRVIVNGVDVPNAVADARGDARPPVAVVIANFHAYKGYADLLHALALVPASAGLRLRLCGTGAERPAMQTLAAELGLAEQVVFVDPPAEVDTELRNAQFAIHPSHTEGLSNAVLEELAAGLPVVACSVGGNPVLITDGGNGLLVPPGDPEALAAALTTLALDPDLRARMGTEARVSAHRFQWSACTEAHVDVYHAVAGRKAL